MDNESLIQEINQDLRADRLQAVWNIYGKWVISLAISVVLVTSIVVYWKHYQRERTMAETALYFKAVAALEAGSSAEALQLLEAMSVPENSSYYSIVMLKKTEAFRRLARHDEATETLKKLSKRGDAYSDVALILLGDSGVASKPTPLHYTRMEWVAWSLAAKGEKQQAAEQFAMLARTEKIPAALQERALMMANYFKHH